MHDKRQGSPNAITGDPATPEQLHGADPMHRDMLELMRSFASIQDSRTRKLILTLVKHLGAAAAAGTPAYKTAA